MKPFIKKFGIDILAGAIFALFIILMMAFSAKAQNVGINNLAPHSKSLLDLTSTDKGLLTPRMTQVQRNAMFPVADATAKGMLVYQTDNTQGFYYYDGATWQLLNSGANGWGVTGNAGTSPATNFFGTTDSNDIAIKTNNQQWMRFTANKKIGIGATTFSNPTARVEIADEDGLNSDFAMRVAGSGYPDITFVKNKGTLAAPLVTAAGDVNGVISNWAHDGTKYLLSSRISFLIDSNTAVNDVAGSIRFYTSNNNLTPEAMRISSNGNTGIGNPNPLHKLDVSGNVNVVADSNYRIGNSRVLSIKGGFNLFVGANTGLNNTGGYNAFVGSGAGAANISGGSNAFFGHYAGVSNTTGSFNSFIGNNAGLANIAGTSNVYVGSHSGFNGATGSNNVFVGFQSGYNNTDSNNVFLGAYAGYTNTSGKSNFFAGYQAGVFNTSGNLNSFSGAYAGAYNTTGSGNAFYGYNAGWSNTTGSYNTYFGSYVGIFNTTSSYNTFIGNGAGRYSTAGLSTFIGANAGYNTSTGTQNTFVGLNSGVGNTTGANNSFLGYYSGFNNTGSDNSFIGNNSGLTNIAGTGNTFLGSNADALSGNLTNAAAIGANAKVAVNNAIALGQVGTMVGIGISSPGFPLNFASTLGDKISLYGNSGAHYGFGIQPSLLQMHCGGSTDDIAFGYGSSSVFTERMRIKGNGKVGIGTSTPGNLFSNAILEIADSTGINKDVIIRTTNNTNLWQALAFVRTRGTFSAPAVVQNGDNLGRVSGAGYDGAAALTAAEIQFHVDSIASANNMPGNITFNTTPANSGTNCLERMRIDRNGNIGINTSAPTAKLHINGSFKICDGTQGAGKVLTSDATGLTSWQTITAVSLNAWSNTGNSGTNAATNFIGTTDANDLSIRTNNLTRLTVTSAGNLGIGSTTPQTRAEINGGLSLLADVSLTANSANFNITVGDRSYIRLNSNSTPPNRLISLSNGLQVGQILMIECSAPGGVNGIRMSDTPATYNTNLATFHDMYENDMITLLWNGTDWIETAYTNN